MCAAASVALFGLPQYAYSGEHVPQVNEDDLKDYLHIMANFDKPQPSDIVLSAERKILLDSALKRLKRVQRTVGFGNFCVLSFDGALAVARNYSAVGKFTRAETDFLDEIFHIDAATYGFYGDKPVKILTAKASSNELVKIPRTGNYLFRGKPQEKYLQIKKQLGDSVYLTSGVRGIMKQFILFLSKAAANEGNMSLASRSLAPPGYSYHAVSDFDVGEKGLGAANFSSMFACSATCARLQELGYLKLRYPENNLLGVRFEPWHIKV